MREGNSLIRRLPALACLLLTGCGYGLVGRTSSLPPDIEEIYIQPLSNRTLREQIDQEFTRAITNEFLRRPRFKIVNSLDEADAVLVGEVSSFQVRAVLFGVEDEGRAREYEIMVLAKMEFRRSGTDEVIWQQPFYQFRENYTFDLEPTSFTDQQDVAVLEVADEFAETLVIDILEGF
ncbi:MAG: LPS assembly lipoprotein LptE [Thermoanaerobaculia bacterium]